MAKDVLNIVDFSGGINKAVDKRDLELNQIVNSDGLMSYRPGKLTLKGALNTIPGLNENTGSFSSQYISEGIPNLYGIFPEFGFRIFGKVKCTGVSGDTGTFIVEPANSYHSLDLGAKITILQSSVDATFVSKNLIITEIVSNTSFKAVDSTGMSTNNLIVYALNADYHSNEQLLSLPTTDYHNNKYFLKAAQYGKFGFYNIGDFRYWYGRSDEGYSNYFSNDPWFFDTKYLWDWKQDNLNHSNEGSINDTKVLDAYYDNGGFRLSVEAPKGYKYGRMVRPVGLYAVDKQSRFDPSYADPNYRLEVEKGWYALRSHCLSPEEYHNLNDNTSSSQNSNGAGLIGTHATAATESAWDTELADPIGVSYYGNSLIPHQLSIGIGTGNNAVSGDWQFANEHSTVKLGISFLYDNIENPSESRISKLVQANLSETVTIISGQNDKALFLYWKIFRGNSTTTTEQNELLDNATGLRSSVAEFRGSNMNDGFSNYGQWNPRIVGANVWLMGNFEGDIDDPLWLATIDFNSTNKSVSHDDIKAYAPWDGATTQGVIHQLIRGIPSVPVLTYSLKNGYKYTDNIHAWYKTSAIVNRRLYVGNVSYFTDTSKIITGEQGEFDAPSHFPDKILRSPVNKLDILPESSFLDIVNNDGQDIVKLLRFNQKLLVFKHDDLIILDCSGEFEYVERIHKGIGISSPIAVCATPNAIYWLNSQGIYALDVENPPVNIIKNMLSTEDWMQNIYNSFSHIEYEPQDNLLIVLTRYKGITNNIIDDKHALIINISQGSLFFKSNPSVIVGNQYSKGVLANNKLYMSVNNAGGDGEIFHAQKSTTHIAAIKASSMVSFKINNSSHNNSFGGTGNKYLMIQKVSTWIKINNNSFVETINESNDIIAANTLIDLFSEKCTVYANNSEYNHSLLYNQNTDTFTAMVEAKIPGSAYILNNESKTGYGETPWALSEDGTEGNIAIGDITDFTVLNNTSGTNTTLGVFRLFADRGSRSTSGTEYTIRIQYGVNIGNDSYETRVILANYITSSDPSLLYNAASSSNYANDSNGSESNLNNSNALITNIHEFLQNNTVVDNIGGIIDLNDHFTFGSITADDGSGTVTGTASLKYFTMTIKDSSPISEYNDTSLTAYASGGTGGSIVRWEGDVDNTINNVILETKDYDFEQPNVRKKIYKAYITYKVDSDIKVYYQANQSGSFTLATITDSTTDNTLLQSAEYTRGEITFGTGGNNIYSFSLKFESTNTVKIFDINDISFIYRIKRAK